jgi:hypothetical protein
VSIFCETGTEILSAVLKFKFSDSSILGHKHPDLVFDV